MAALAIPATAVAHHDDQHTTLYVPDSTTFLLSKSVTGSVPNGPSRNPAITHDQRLAKIAAFESDASDIVAGDVNGLTDVFYRRRAEPYGNNGAPWHGDAARLASTAMNGQPANGSSYLPDLDGDPKHLDPHCLAFISDASNLVPGDTNGVADAFVRNLHTGAIRRVSVSSSGRQANGPSFDVSLSGACTRVAFTSTATNLALRTTRQPTLKRLTTTAPPAGTKQVYVKVLGRDPRDGTLPGVTFLASAANKRAGNGDSFDPDWSRSGKGFVFTSTATNLSVKDGASNHDVYFRQTRRVFRKYRVIECRTKRRRGRSVRICHRTVRGRQTLDLVTRWVSEGGDGESQNASITDDMRLIAFESSADNLVRRDTNGHVDVFRADMREDPPATLMLSRTKRHLGNGDSHNAMISAGGVATFFDSDASNLKMFPDFLDDTNRVRDMEVGIPIHGAATADSLTWQNHFADGPSQNPAPSARHNYVLFESTATNIDRAVPNPLRQQAIYLRYDGPFSGDAVTEP